MILNNKNKEEIVEHAKEEFPNECCGLLVDNKIVRCKNVSNNKKELFEIDIREYLSASKIGTINAYYHSHTEGNEDFSIFDKLISYVHQLPVILYSVPSNSFKIYG